MSGLSLLSLLSLLTLLSILKKHSRGLGAPVSVVRIRQVVRVEVAWSLLVSSTTNQLSRGST